MDAAAGESPDERIEAPERLCGYPQYMDPDWMEQGVLDAVKLGYWSFIPRRGSGRGVSFIPF